MKSIKKTLLCSAVALSVLAGTIKTSADIQTDTVNEKWGKPTLVYGVNLSDEQVTQVNNALGIKNIDNVVRQVANQADMTNYLGFDASETSMYSSVMVQKREKGKGVHVVIKTPELITAITPSQYANAAITAGATDLEIEVAAPFAVTGESALTGVYKALSANGTKVDTERTVVAQSEITIVKEISEQNSERADFDSTLLDNLMADLKVQLAEYKEKNGDVAQKDVIKDIINKVVKDNGLDGVLTEDQINQLVDFASAYQNTSAIDSKEVLNQLGDLKDSISENVSKLLKSANEHGVWDKTVSFFSSIWDTIVSLFN